MTEPSREEVLAWLGERGNRTAEDAADRWWPSLDATARARLLVKIRQWVWRAKKKREAAPSTYRTRSGVQPVERQAGDPMPGDEEPERAPSGPPASNASVVEGPPRPLPRLELARMERIPFLEWQLSEIAADLEWVRASGLVGRVQGLDHRLSVVAEQLFQARKEAGHVVIIDKDPAAIAEQILKRQEKLEALARSLAEARAEEAQRVARERDL